MDDIIAIDESSISIGLSIRKGRSEIGKRLNKITKDNKVFVKYTLIMAISTKGVVAWKLYEKKMYRSSTINRFFRNIH